MTGLVKNGMFKYPLSLALIAIVFFNGCISHYYAHYQNPFHNNPIQYRTIPLASDSEKVATYAGGSVTGGSQNYNLRDNMFMFTGTAHRSHVFGKFRGFYGANGSFGTYHIRSYENSLTDKYVDTLYINRRSGSTFFAGLGISGGLSYTTRLGRRGEWRIAGLDFNLIREFGDYLSFRKGLTDTSANTIDRNRLFGTIGFSTDLIFRRRSKAIGYRVAVLVSTNRSRRIDEYRNDYRSYNPASFQQTLHITSKRVTGFATLSVGDNALGFHTGLNYRLGKSW